MIVITGADLRRLVSVDDAIAAVRSAFIATTENSVWQPARLVSPDHGTLMMVAASDGGHSRGVGAVFKAVSIRPGNKARGIPTLSAAVLCFDHDSGEPCALIDGRTMTALRTGAASGVATALLAPASAEVLALIGTGAQAIDQLRAVAAVRPLKTVRVAARSYESAQRFTEELARSDEWVDSFELLPTKSPTEAATDADIICCATSSTLPLFPITTLKRRVHINAIGAFTADMCEIDEEILEQAQVVAVDQRDSALEEAGDLIQAIRAGRLDPATLVEIGALLRDPPRAVEGISIFKSVGVAAQDWAVAALAVDRGINSHLPTLQLW